jgi:hypothetical protein
MNAIFFSLSLSLSLESDSPQFVAGFDVGNDGACGLYDRSIFGRLVACTLLQFSHLEVISSAPSISREGETNRSLMCVPQSGQGIRP